MDLLRSLARNGYRGLGRIWTHTDVHVHPHVVVELPEGLYLAVGVAQRPMVPDADVVDCRLILLYLRRVELPFGGVKSHIDDEGRLILNELSEA